MSGVHLHGRDGELDALAAAVSAVAGGAHRAVVVRGEAGIGKTALVGVIRGRLRANRFLVLEGRATELESDVPLVPMIDALSPVLAEVPVAARHGLGEEHERQLERVLPGWGPGEGGGAEHAAERWRLHRALGDLLGVIGRGRPVALVLDDVHWADPATLELIEHLIRRPPPGPLLVVLALRPGDAADRIAAAQRSTASANTDTLDLAPLRAADADALMESIEDPARRAVLFHESGGNPLLLHELCRAPEAGGVPGGVVQAVRAEIEGLPVAPRALIEAAAIAGDPFDLDVAAPVAGLDAHACLDALDALAGRALVRGTDAPRRFAFRHPVVRSAVYAAIAPGARLAGHAATARELARAGAPTPVVARHLAHAAAPGDVAAATTLRAAATAVRPQAPGTAANWLLAAARADPHGAGAHGAELAGALVESGRLDESLAVVDAALSDGAAHDPVGLALAGASVERFLGRHGAAQRRLEEALARTAPDGPGAARLMADLALSAYERGAQLEMLGWARRARAIPGAGVAATAATAAMQATGHAFVGDRDAADAEIAVLLSALERAPDDELVGATELLLAVPWGLLALERLSGGLATARRLAATARRAGNGPAAVGHEVAATLALALMGRIDEAAGLADRTEQAARVTGNDQALQWALWMRAWVLIERGDLDAALAGARESTELGERLDDSALSAIARTVLGAALAACGDHAAGRDLLARYDIEPGWICRWSPSLVEADLALGDLPSAAAHAERAADLAARVGLAGARTTARRAQALVALADRDPAVAARQALAAADAAREGGFTLDEARARLVAGRALGADDREGALRELRAAEAGAAACGAPRLRDEVRRELRAQGHRAGRGGARAPGEEGLAALTGREREIAEHVARGLTNREIGERLYLSEKTIETHLSHTFSKLGVRSRAEVAARVAAEETFGAG